MANVSLLSCSGGVLMADALTPEPVVEEGVAVAEAPAEATECAAECVTETVAPVEEAAPVAATEELAAT
jgi:hypothetical protein